MSYRICRVTMSEKTKFGIRLAREFEQKTFTVKLNEGWESYGYAFLPDHKTYAESPKLGVKMEVLDDNRAGHIEYLSWMRSSDKLGVFIDALFEDIRTGG